jgi:hypothetical protein
MKNKYYWNWLKYYLNLNKNLESFYFPTIKLLEELESSVYLEHSISCKNNEYSKFRWLICLSDLNKIDYLIITNYLNSIFEIKQTVILKDILNLEWGIIEYSDIILGFDYNLKNPRIKFYYTSIRNNTEIDTLFEWLSFNNIIKWYDILLNEKKILNKTYLVLNKNDLLNNKERLITIFWKRLYKLFNSIDWLNIALKNNWNFISLDFKFNWNMLFLELLSEYYNFTINNLDVNFNKTTFLSIKYDIKLGILDINNFNLYFYE